MKTPDLRWFLLMSIAIHALFLWRWSLTPLCEPPSPSSVKTRLLSSSFLHLPGETSAPGSQPLAVLGKLLSRQGKPSPQERTDQPNASSAGAEGTSSSTGETSFPDGGTLSAGVGSPSATGGTSAGGGGTSAEAQGEFSGTQGGSGGGGKTASTGTKTSAASTPIPELSPHYYRYRLNNSYFVEVDHYVLEGMNIPGTDLCIAGDQLRTKGPITITQVKTDHSKCRVRTRGDEEKEICPPEARSEVVFFQGQLNSPLSYSVNTCREYDKSHCHVRGLGTDREREYCKVDFKYQGVWAADTILEYKCTNSETVTYRHPLEYKIRYMVEVEKAEERVVSREVHRVTQSISQCY